MIVIVFKSHAKGLTIEIQVRLCIEKKRMEILKKKLLKIGNNCIFI